MRKRLVLSAALAVFGCADADTGGEGPLPYSNDGIRTVLDPAASPSTSEVLSPAPDGSENGGSEGGNGEPAPTSASEGQNGENLPIAPGNGGAPSPAPSNAGGAAVAPSQGSGQPGTQQPGTQQPGTQQPGTQQPGTQQPGTQPPTPPAEPAEPPPPAPPPPPPPLNCNAPRPQLTGGTQACNVNANGRVDAGQSWFMWYAGSNGCMTPFEGYGGAFRANWNNSGDFLARMGQGWDETQSHDEIGEIYAELAFTRTGTAGGYSFIGVYGWSNNPLVEYYIVEDSYNNGPAVPFATQQRGTFNADGAQYRIYTGTKTNQPSIHGTATFLQVFSVRQTPRNCGRISVSQHFRQWEGMGIDLGDMYEARVLVEAGGGTGSATFTTARVLVE